MALDNQFAPFAERMRAEGLPEVVIDTFRFYYAKLLEGSTGQIHEKDILPIDTLPDTSQFPESLQSHGMQVIPKTVVIKLNGGLGTSMGMRQAKTLLPVRDGLSFLDIIARQATAIGVPLVLMNSFATREDSLAALKQYPKLWKSPLGLDFVQHKFPKVLQSDLTPASWPDDPHHEWNPPGHGDLYTALVTSGMLSRLLEHRYEYAFISNGDNLGAVLDPAILGYFAEQRLPFMMEVTDRTEADRKGGHLARLPWGQLILRESAQCPRADEKKFQDITRHRYFNTNNLWVNLPALKNMLDRQNNILGLPLIRNRKSLDPRDPDTPPIYQLETAMGSAIGIFEGAQAIRVPRSRFAPVKTTNDLLVVRSDAYIMTDDFRVIPNPKRTGKPPVVELDPDYYKMIDDMEARFPHGAPSLIDCDFLTVEGDVIFGKGVKVEGTAKVSGNEGNGKIEAGALLKG